MALGRRSEALLCGVLPPNPWEKDRVTKVNGRRLFYLMPLYHLD
jgi:hypothetical protein